jgi:hypothetical protein
MKGGIGRQMRQIMAMVQARHIAAGVSALQKLCKLDRTAVV